MPALLFNKCCLCIDLKTGCFIIAYFNLVMEIIMITLTLLALIGGSVVAAEGGSSSDSHAQQAQQAGVAVVVVSVILLLLLFFFLAFTIVLLVGLHKNKRGHLKAYLIYACIFIVISVITFFASFAGSPTAGNIIQNIITLLLSVYFILVIRSYYYKMDDKRPAIYNTA